MAPDDLGPTTRFPRVENRGVLLGLSGAQVVVVGAALALAVLAVYSAGATGLVMTAPLWLPLVVAGTLGVRGRAVVDWMPICTSWAGRRLSSLTSAAASTRSRLPRSRLSIPGVRDRLLLVDAPEIDAALVVNRTAATTTGVLRVAGTGFLLEDGAVRESSTDTWGRALAGLCQQGSVVRVQVIVRARAGGLTEARGWWRRHTGVATSGVAAELARMLDEPFVVPRTHEVLVALTLRSHRGRRGDASRDAASTQTLRTFATTLAAAGVAPQEWLNRDGLLRRLRSGYVPEQADRAEDARPSAGLDVGVRETWSHVATGAAVHATYWVSDWPRSEAPASFLQPLLLGHGDDRTVSLLAEPLPLDKALRDIRRAKVEHVADAAQRTRMGQIESEATRAELAEIERREAQLVAGHGDLRFTGLITVTARDERELAERCASMETAATQAMCEVRLLVGQQGAAQLACCQPIGRGVL